MKTLRNLIRYFLPPPEWRLPVIILLGIFTGLGLYTAHISNALSYLSEDPKACINCHVMATQYATWMRSSHGRSVTCMDCHVPHDNILHKYLFKAEDGTRHAAIFTLRKEPQVIRIKAAGIAAVQSNCVRCHADVIHQTNITQQNGSGTARERLCWDCHRETPHGRVRSLSAVPFARVPRLEDVVPEWMREMFPDNHNQRGER